MLSTSLKIFKIKYRHDCKTVAWIFISTYDHMKLAKIGSYVLSAQLFITSIHDSDAQFAAKCLSTRNMHI